MQTVSPSVSDVQDAARAYLKARRKERAAAAEREYARDRLQTPARQDEAFDELSDIIQAAYTRSRALRELMTAAGLRGIAVDGRLLVLPAKGRPLVIPTHSIH